MLLLEHQGKACLRNFGIATPRSVVVSSRQQLEAALHLLPSGVVLKAQVAVGRRGKSGGILFASSPEEAIAAFSQLEGFSVSGHLVQSVLIEEKIAIADERFAAVSTETGELQLLLGIHGGVDIEELAAQNPANVAAISISPDLGVDAARVRDTLQALSFGQNLIDQYIDFVHRLFTAARALDALTVEVNPLVEKIDGTLWALDARISVDPRSLRRQSSLSNLLEAEAEQANRLLSAHDEPLPKIIRSPAGGTIGLIGLGSGLNATIMDWIASKGAKVHSFTDMDDSFAAGQTADGFSRVFDYFDNHPEIRAILVNVITCGYKLDEIVAELASAFAKRVPERAKPVSFHLRGNRFGVATEILANFGLHNNPTLEEAIDRTIRAAGGE